MPPKKQNKQPKLQHYFRKQSKTPTPTTPTQPATPSPSPKKPLISEPTNPPLPVKRKVVGKLEHFIIQTNAARNSSSTLKQYVARELLLRLTREELFEKVGSLQKIIIDFLVQHTKDTLPVPMLRQLLFKFLRGKNSSLWMDKYRPSRVSDLLSRETAQKIKEWLKSFNLRGGSSEDDAGQNGDDSDYGNSISRQHGPAVLRKQMQTAGKGLILYGREGAGKLTILRCLAESLGINLQVCTNEGDRMAFLKEKNETTKSECVKLKKKSNGPPVVTLQNSIIKFLSHGKSKPKNGHNAVASIDKKMGSKGAEANNPKNPPNGQHKQQQKQQPVIQLEERLINGSNNTNEGNMDSVSNSANTKTMFVIHQVNKIYPEEKKKNFNDLLQKTMRDSMVPFVLTASEQEVPLQFGLFTSMDIIEPTKNQLTCFFWAVYHIENLLGQHKVQGNVYAGELFSKLDEMANNADMRELITLQEMREIVEICRCSFERLYSFFQFEIINHATFYEARQKLLEDQARRLQNLRFRGRLPNLPYQQNPEQLNLMFKLKAGSEVDSTQSCVQLSERRRKFKKIQEDDDISSDSDKQVIEISQPSNRMIDEEEYSRETEELKIHLQSVKKHVENDILQGIKQSTPYNPFLVSRWKHDITEFFIEKDTVDLKHYFNMREHLKIKRKILNVIQQKVYVFNEKVREGIGSMKIKIHELPWINEERKARRNRVLVRWQQLAKDLLQNDEEVKYLKYFTPV